MAVAMDVSENIAGATLHTPELPGTLRKLL